MIADVFNKWLILTNYNKDTSSILQQKNLILNSKTEILSKKAHSVHPFLNSRSQQHFTYFLIQFNRTLKGHLRLSCSLSTCLCIWIWIAKFNHVELHFLIYFYSSLFTFSFYLFLQFVYLFIFVDVNLHL